ncbi:uncharacterized protein LOC105642232 isoform X2 [Jatropha curcas]|uniref:uncharacterized protein LOC105642232 isoform X2 n=1 Tax=Jatropha curcas TaxID=180498 RepID=UPI0005FAFFA5|nr:uncharacterized protein LOC105642232 isoform X2 [Jatropha curcas]
MGRANMSEVGQDSRAVTPVCTENPSLEFIGTSSPMVHPDTSAVQRNAIPLNQIPIPTASSSLAHSSPDTSTFIGIQNHQSNASHASTQEVQVSRQSLSKGPIEFANACVQGLPLPRPRSTQRIGNETRVHGPRTRTSMNDPSFHTNYVIPDIPKLAGSDPLPIEIERILRDERHELRMHEDMVLHIISEREKEMREIFKKYEVLLQDAERAVHQKMEDHRTNLQYVYLSKLLAETLMLKHQDYKGAVPPDTRQGI